MSIPSYFFSMTSSSEYSTLIMPVSKLIFCDSSLTCSRILSCNNISVTIFTRTVLKFEIKTILLWIMEANQCKARSMDRWGPWNEVVEVGFLPQNENSLVWHNLWISNKGVAYILIKFFIVYFCHSRSHSDKQNDSQQELHYMIN